VALSYASLKGDDLAIYVVAANQAGKEAAQTAVRRAAFGARRDIQSQIRERFGTSGRIYAAKGWAKAIVVKKQSPDWYSVVDKATYSKKRTGQVGLTWVFDNAPMITGKKGWVAVPIKGQAPIASSGRRYMWPSEADKAGYQLDVVQIIGKPIKVIFGKRGAQDPWTAMWFLIPPYRAAKRLDLDGTYNRYAVLIEPYWLDEFDKRLAGKAQRLAA
jgi:hypothetical protein